MAHIGHAVVRDGRYSSHFDQSNSTAVSLIPPKPLSSLCNNLEEWKANLVEDHALPCSNSLCALIRRHSMWFIHLYSGMICC